MRLTSAPYCHGIYRSGSVIYSAGVVALPVTPVDCSELLLPPAATQTEKTHLGHVARAVAPGQDDRRPCAEESLVPQLQRLLT